MLRERHEPLPRRTARPAPSRRAPGGGARPPSPHGGAHRACPLPPRPLARGTRRRRLGRADRRARRLVRGDRAFPPPARSSHPAYRHSAPRADAARRSFGPLRRGTRLHRGRTRRLPPPLRPPSPHRGLSRRSRPCRRPRPRPRPPPPRPLARRGGREASRLGGPPLGAADRRTGPGDPRPGARRADRGRQAPGGVRLPARRAQGNACHP